MCRIVTPTDPFVSARPRRPAIPPGRQGRLGPVPMVIKASAAAEIRELVSALAADDEVSREAAIARLGVIGERAVTRLVSTFRATEDRRTKLAVLRAIEPSGDSRALPIAREGLDIGGELAVAAASVLRGLLHSPDVRTSTDALDALLAAVTRPDGEHRVRHACADALRDVPAVRAQVTGAMRDVPHASQSPGEAADAALAAGWRDILEGRLPDGPALVLAAVRARAHTAPPGALKELIDRLRAREEQTEARDRPGWRAARGAVHQVLALGGSRLATYDLRETVERAREPLPPSFLAALHAGGDESCLEAIAAAYDRAGEDRWRAQLREAFRAILARERISRRRASLKRIAARWPAAARELMA